MQLVIFRYSCILLASLASLTVVGQSSVLIHSHNDYHRAVPFYQAYAQGVDSYEADVFFDSASQQLLVAHEPEKLDTTNTLYSLYIRPIVAMYNKNNGRAWRKSEKRIYLLIDIKQNYEQSIPALLKLLQLHPEVFEPSQNPYSPIVVLSGSVPSPDLFKNYPPVFFFDGRPNITYTAQQLSRLALISDSFSKYTRWNGKGSLIPAEKKALEQVIDQVHRQGKKIRFWGTPDNLNSWQILRTMGIDIMNTDKPEACTAYFKNENKQNFQFLQQNTATELIKTDKLDKTTRTFQGFWSGQSLKSPVPVYKPTGKPDGNEFQPLNIILLIGDGMGLAQLSAADLVNGGLSTTQIRNCGFQRTTPRGSYISDSAGAGSALATGVSTPNRHIATDEAGKSNPSITELMIKKGKLTGIVTNGNIADATPAAFYAHAVERDDSDLITSWLLKNQLHFVAGSGKEVLEKRNDNRDLTSELKQQYQLVHSVTTPTDPTKPVLILDEELGKSASNSNLELLATTTQQAIQHLESKNGFFLMVEGAKIDYAGHVNSFPNSIIETLAFDLAVQEALRYADQHGNTLVIVTGDHETGGLSIIDGDIEQRRIAGVYSSDDHTPVFLPVFAYGPGSGAFRGVYHNTEIFHRIVSVFKLN